MLGSLFDVFSRRNRAPVSAPRALTREFRDRFFMLLRDVQGERESDTLREMQTRLAYLHGRHILSDSHSMPSTPTEDVITFLLTCEDLHFLDAIEYVFQLPAWHLLGNREEQFIDQLNEFLDIDDLPYYITKAIWEDYDTAFHGIPAQGRRLRSRPQVIRRDSDTIHVHVLKPALALLRQPDLLHANDEFMMGLTDYKNGDYRDCVAKCCSSLESVLKVICNRKKYPYKQSDTASILLKTLLTNSSLDAFWEQPLILIATIRNKLSTSHGAGVQSKNVPPHVAKYVVNATAAAILLVCDESY